MQSNQQQLAPPVGSEVSEQLPLGTRLGTTPDPIFTGAYTASVNALCHSDMCFPVMRETHIPRDVCFPTHIDPDGM